MEIREFAGINSFLVEMSRTLLRESVIRKTRGVTCFELPYPVIIKITNPTSRIVTIPERSWNCFLPYAESLWLASGRNDLKMAGTYLKRLYDFSDDEKTMRAGYGPRLRFFNGVSNDHQNDNSRTSRNGKKRQYNQVDQFQFIEKCFQKDPFTRQAVITLADPAKDSLNRSGGLKQTKDFPCTRELHFIRKGDQLDLIVNMRSNDFFWGATGVNIFNYTFMQEYFAQILGLELGHYYHIVNNLHFYEAFKAKLARLADISRVEDGGHFYSKSFKSLKEFDEMISILEIFEEGLRNKQVIPIPNFQDDFFDDWAKMLYSFHCKSTSLSFSNPQLNSIINGTVAV